MSLLLQLQLPIDNRCIHSKLNLIVYYVKTYKNQTAMGNKITKQQCPVHCAVFNFNIAIQNIIVAKKKIQLKNPINIVNKVSNEFTHAR